MIGFDMLEYAAVKIYLLFIVSLILLMGALMFVGTQYYIKATPLSECANNACACVRD